MPLLDDFDVRQLLELGRDAASNDERRFGDYTIVRELGRGGMGVVYEARIQDIDFRVALKILLEGELASEALTRRFLSEADKVASLQHPNIVPVWHVGHHEGCPFFTMPLLAGQSLAHALRARRSSSDDSGLQPKQAWLTDARLMAKVARAVHHAHEHGLLHRDLKPANILLDEAGEPYIADFGLARRVDEQTSHSSPGDAAGTLSYMAPEQARGGDVRFTADVYGLGAILYELLTGRPPFQCRSAPELLQRITDPVPAASPRSVEPRVPEDLSAICLKAIEKDPARRHPTALEFANDLEAVLHDRPPPSIPPLTLRGRVHHWMRRNPRRAARIARTTLFLLLIGATLTYTWQERRREARLALETNSFIASGQAGAVLFQLREYADRVQQAARDPAIQRLAASASPTDDPPLALKELAEGLDVAFLMSKDGYQKGHWPGSQMDINDRSFAFRDYFRGARWLARHGKRSAYVARAYRSEGDGMLKFGLSAPVFHDGQWTGVLVGAIAAHSVFGKVRMQESSNRRRITALIGPRDRERDEPDSKPHASRFVFAAHDGLRKGDEVPAPQPSAVRAAFEEASPPGEQFTLKYVSPQGDPYYRDPVRGFPGWWQAAFAPVGGTGYVVVVQTPRRDWFQWLSELARTWLHSSNGAVILKQLRPRTRGQTEMPAEMPREMR